jgi:hypothetical protein
LIASLWATKSDFRVKIFAIEFAVKLAGRRVKTEHPALVRGRTQRRLP